MIQFFTLGEGEAEDDGKNTKQAAAETIWN